MISNFISRGDVFGGNFTKMPIKMRKFSFDVCDSVLLGVGRAKTRLNQ